MGTMSAFWESYRVDADHLSAEALAVCNSEIVETQILRPRLRGDEEGPIGMALQITHLLNAMQRMLRSWPRGLRRRFERYAREEEQEERRQQLMETYREAYLAIFGVQPTENIQKFLRNAARAEVLALTIQGNTFIPEIWTNEGIA